jgi:hypothetical protein
MTNTPAIPSGHETGDEFPVVALPDPSQYRAELAAAPEDSTVTLAGIAGAIALLETVRGGKRLPERMDPEATRCLGHVGVYTTTLPQNPGWFPGYYWRTARTEHELDKVHDNMAGQLALVRSEDERTLAPALVRELGAITDVTVDDTRIDPDKYGGTVVLRGTALSVPTESPALALEDTFQVGLSAERGKFSKVETVTTDTGSPGITIATMTEYDIRNVETALWLQVARWLKEQTRTTFPPDKLTLADAEKDGHTFRPDVRAWLVACREHYHRLAGSLHAEYTGFKDERQPRIDADPLIQTAGVVFDILRKVVNGAREAHHVNTEINPNPRAPKLNIMQNVNLARRRTTPEEQKRAPGRQIAMGRVARWRAATYADVKENPGRTVVLGGIKLAGKAAGGVGSLVELAADGLQYVPFLGNGAKQFLNDRRKWKQLRQEAEDALPDVDRALIELEILRRELGAGSSPEA